MFKQMSIFYQQKLLMLELNFCNVPSEYDLNSFITTEILNKAKSDNNLVYST